MPVKLSVTPATDPGSLEQYTFNKDRVTIGRDPACDVVLPDVKRIVSKQHAALQIGPSGFELVDLGSKNFTFLNGMRLKSEQPEPLQSGDEIRIGEFEIGFTLIETEPAPAPDQDRTVFLLNPFDELAAQLANTLSRLDGVYQKEVPVRREEALREALRKTLDEDTSEVQLLLARALSVGTESEVQSSQIGPQPDAAPLVPSPVAPSPRSASMPPAAAPIASPPESVVPRSAPRAGYDPGTAYERVLDTLLQFVPKLLGLPWRFRHEFIGQTIMHSPDAIALFEGGPDDVRRYLLDSSVSEEELQRRVTLLSETADEVVFHALAMVDGYRASVENGMTRMIDEIDPARMEEEIKRQGGILNILPLIREVKLVARLKDKVAELRREDWSVVERRIYRPAFIKAYLGRMTSRRRPVGSPSH